MKMKLCGENCIQITDMASGITVVGTGTSSQVKFNFILIKNNLN